jgi:hypothetical protein
MTTTRALPMVLLAAAIGANVAFAGLALVFDYPDVLAQPAPDVMSAFAANRPAVPLLFLLLAGAAAALAPAAVGLSRFSPRNARAIAGLGIAAAAVQVIGLLRWPLLVPHLTDPDTFAMLSTVLGTIIGETLGYALTAMWTLVVVRALTGQVFGAWMARLGIGSALLIAAGLLTPVGVPGADLANFAGYLLWSAWLVALAVILIRSRTNAAAVSPGPAHGVG